MIIEYNNNDNDNNTDIVITITMIITIIIMTTSMTITNADINNNVKDDKRVRIGLLKIRKMMCVSVIPQNLCCHLSSHFTSE